jgi:hypothetical protein
MACKGGLDATATFSKHHALIYIQDCYRFCLYCFVMLSLAKHCCTDCSSFSITSLRFVIPPFALMQKVEPKNQGKPEPLRASCRPRTTTVITAFTIHVLRSKKHVSLLLTTFSKWHAFPSSVTNARCCIPLSFF